MIGRIALTLYLGCCMACGDATDTGTGAGGSGAMGGNGTGGTASDGGQGTGGIPFMLECDSGVVGDASAKPDTPEAATCSACVTCAFEENCHPLLLAFQQKPGCLPPANEPTSSDDFYSCAYGNSQADPETTGCPEDDPRTADDEFVLCYDDCAAQYAGCGEALDALLGCAICAECPINCDAEANCVPGD